MSIIVREFSFDRANHGSVRAVGLVRLLLGGLACVRLISTIEGSALQASGLWALEVPIYVLIALMMTVGLFAQLTTFATGLILLAIYYSSLVPSLRFLSAPFRTAGSLGQPTNLYFLAVIILLLAWSPCGQAFSLDTFRGKQARFSTPTFYGVQLIRLQVCAMYLWAAVEKCNPSYLHGHVLEQVWMLLVSGPLRDPPPQTVAWLISVLSAGFELCLGLLLFVPSTRVLGVLVGTFFHLFTLLILPVGPFSFAVIFSYILFLDSSQVESAFVLLGRFIGEVQPE